jgi:hypothetical protein
MFFALTTLFLAWRGRGGGREGTFISMVDLSEVYTVKKYVYQR